MRFLVRVRAQRGLTLIELLIVVAVISIIAAVNGDPLTAFVPGVSVGLAGRHIESSC